MTTKEYNNTEIAKRVELLRKRSGMSINKMATMAGIDTGNLSRSINGKASFSDRVIYKIASALHVSVDWLEKGIEPMFSPTVASPSEVGAGIIGSNIDASNSKGFTQTISPTDALARELELLRKMVSDKDEEIKFLRAQLSTKISGSV
ncbi:helix-turn-helix domain-containing protein [Segatella copri]|jgi:transcriptional regulator with XRE-family HTH domain|uniref:XRE family transcriptional regulator n=1 Tax=Segatella copri TaxID=165179 RepID=A0AA92UX41_9BACT|nr:helix-turn-helix transcriptional regulator [Segatella copri]UVN03678.1 MAG: helix-turn-helix domain protein [Bacteriophage sp.]DAU38732.1 MAG TPA: helix-turn-helix domain protein [Caudoviricetes sp.]RGW71051.1 XRE family transcriptional regulator [Segatella copri]RHA82616.1 XRE family transcriptional regulator [Segatella copri]UWD65983.1 MAG: helix-turn-helix domain protein [Bacteriophage sp.]